MEKNERISRKVTLSENYNQNCSVLLVKPSKQCPFKKVFHYVLALCQYIPQLTVASQNLKNRKIKYNILIRERVYILSTVIYMI